MKKIVMILLVALLGFSSSVSAETNRIGTEYTVDDLCLFKIKRAESYDVFFNYESGSSKEWIVISFELLNLKTDPFFVKTETSAQIVFDEDFEFTPDFLWTNPEGSYINSYDEKLFVYLMDDNGKIYNNLKDENGGYSRPCLRDLFLYYYDPVHEYFCFDKLTNIDGEATYKSQDSSKTILDPLVKRTYHYVFLVPDMVAAEEGARELIFTVGNEEYLYRF